MGIINNAALPSRDDMENMTHAQLARLRDERPNDADYQAAVAPYEHQAFAREFTKDSPIIGPLSVAAATPLYTAAKAIGATDAMKRAGLLDNDGGTESPASWEEIARAYKGIGQGLGDVATSAAKTAADYLNDAWKALSQ